MSKENLDILKNELKKKKEELSFLMNHIVKTYQNDIEQLETKISKLEGYDHKIDETLLYVSSRKSVKYLSNSKVLAGYEEIHFKFDEPELFNFILELKDVKTNQVYKVPPKSMEYQLNHLKGSTNYQFELLVYEYYIVKKGEPLFTIPIQVKTKDYPKIDLKCVNYTIKNHLIDVDMKWDCTDQINFDFKIKRSINPPNKISIIKETKKMEYIDELNNVEDYIGKKLSYSIEIQSPLFSKRIQSQEVTIIIQGKYLCSYPRNNRKEDIP